MTRRTRTLIDALVLAIAVAIFVSHWARPREETAGRSTPSRRPPTLYRRANA
jgi:hypothetical protein